MPGRQRYVLASMYKNLGLVRRPGTPGQMACFPRTLRVKANNPTQEDVVSSSAARATGPSGAPAQRLELAGLSSAREDGATGVTPSAIPGERTWPVRAVRFVGSP